MTNSALTRTVVIGVGNVLLSDEGAGVHAARRVHAALQGRDDVRVIDGGTLSFTLAMQIEQADRLILLDAAQLHAPAGTVRAFFDAALDRFLGKARLSVHEVGLVDLFDIARLTGALPAQRVLIGIQPQTLTWGEEVTSEVAGGVASAVGLALELVDAWPAHADAAAYYIERAHERHSES
jgi:hydrogenase maturation protease